MPVGGGPRASSGAGVRIVLRIPPSWATETSIGSELIGELVSYLVS